ncbi:MAG: hypothetical protein K1X70_09545 [Leptospirales bacterium]|nr:hypothetical protein [Leptospirales bacterium]
MSTLSLPELIFLYANNYLKAQVDQVLAEENWSNQDFDKKYWDYVRNYLEIRKQHEKGPLSKELLLETLDRLKKIRLKETHSRLFNSLIGGLRKEFPITDAVYDAVKARLKPFMEKDDIDLNIIVEMRKIEQELKSNDGKI